MKINKITPLIISRNNNIKPILKEKNIQNSLNFANSDNAIKNYALSQITFKGESTPPTPEEFGYKKGRFDYNENADKAKRLIFEKYSSDPKLYENEEINKHIKYIFRYAFQPQEAQKTIKVLEKYATDTEWQNSDFVNNNSFWIMCTNSDEQIIDFVDRFVKNPQLFEIPNLKDTAKNQLIHIRAGESYKAKTRIIDKYLSEPKLNTDQKFQTILPTLIRDTKLEEEIQGKMEIINKYLNDSRCSQTEEIQDLFIDLMKYVNFPSKEKSRIAVIDFLLEDTERLKTKEQRETALKFIFATINPARKDIALFLLDNFDKLKEHIDVDNMTRIIGRAKTPEQVKGQKEILNKFIENPILLNNENIIANIKNIFNISEYTTENTIKGRLAVIDKYLSEPELQESENINKKLGRIITESVNPEQADIIIKSLLDSKN